MWNAIALVQFGASTTPHNIRVGGYKKEESAKKALDNWCRNNNIRFGYVQQYGKPVPVYVRGV